MYIYALVSSTLKVVIKLFKLIKRIEGFNSNLSTSVIIIENNLIRIMLLGVVQVKYSVAPGSKFSEELIFLPEVFSYPSHDLDIWADIFQFY